MAPYPPHAVCWLWNQWLIALHFWSDLALAVAYVAIPAVIAHIAGRSGARNSPIALPRVRTAIELFVLSCALTHLASAITVYVPIYWLSGGINAAAALISAWAFRVIYSVRREAIAILVEMVKAYDGET